VLIANRKDIQSGNDWNQTLRKGVTAAIMAAMLSFSISPSTKVAYSWPEYFECLWAVHNAFLRPIAVEAIQIWNSQQLVESEGTDSSGSKMSEAPQSLLIVGSAFRDVEGKLLLDDASLLQKIPASAYTDKSLRVFRKLGARDFTFVDFVERLECSIRRETLKFKGRSSEWHTSISRVLLSHLRGNVYGVHSAQYSTCKSLPIIPLRGGEWASAASTGIFLVGNCNQQIPDGLTVRFVDSDAAANPFRNELFRLLGVKSCNETEICTQIIAKHRHDLQSRPLLDLVSQAVFLFRAQYRPRSSDTLRVADSTDHIRRMGQIHIPFGSTGRKIRCLFAPDFERMIWLHPQYENAVGAKHEEKWVQWLVQWDTIHLFPPVVVDHRLSPHMRHILERNGSKAFLNHLKEQMKTNGCFSGLNTRNSSAVAGDIKELQVLTDFGAHQLCETVMPALREAGLGLLPVLDIDEPNDMGWSFLENYGVLTRTSLDFYLRQLRSLKATGDLKLLDEHLRKVYKSIEQCGSSQRSIL
jgi:hypothetical protein